MYGVVSIFIININLVERWSFFKNNDIKHLCVILFLLFFFSFLKILILILIIENHILSTGPLANSWLNKLDNESIQFYLSCIVNIGL